MDRDEILLFMCDIFLGCLNKWSKNVVQNAQLQMLQAEHYMTSQQPLSIWRIWHREKINRPSYFIRLLGVNHVCLRCSKSGLGRKWFHLFTLRTHHENHLELKLAYFSSLLCLRLKIYNDRPNNCVNYIPRPNASLYQCRTSHMFDVFQFNHLILNLYE